MSIADAEQVRPPDLDSALELLDTPDARDARDTPTVCMGGTDLLPRLRRGERAATSILLCRRIPELQGLLETPAGLRIGAAVTYRQLAESDVVGTALPALRDLSASLGNPRVRNRGTLGGHLCAARSRYDLLTLLAAAGAQAQLRSRRGTRVVPVTDLVVGEGRTVVGRDELLVWTEIPAMSAGERLGFERIGTSQGPMANVAVRLGPEGARIAVGRVHGSPVVMDLPDVSTSGSSSARDIDELAEYVREASWSQEPGLASPWYRSRLVAVLTRRLIGELTGGEGR